MAIFTYAVQYILVAYLCTHSSLCLLILSCPLTFLFPTGSHSFVLYIYDFFSVLVCYVYLLYFLDCTGKW